MNKLTKKRRKELRELYYKIQGERYIKGIQEQPFISLMDYFDLTEYYKPK